MWARSKPNPPFRQSPNQNWALLEGLAPLGIAHRTASVEKRLNPSSISIDVGIEIAVGQESLHVLSREILRESIFVPDMVGDQLCALVPERSLEAVNGKLEGYR